MLLPPEPLDRLPNACRAQLASMHFPRDIVRTDDVCRRRIDWMDKRLK